MDSTNVGQQPSRSPSSSDSESQIDDNLVADRNMNFETAAAYKMLQLVHKSFPLAVVKDDMLISANDRPINNRKFKLSDPGILEKFIKARTDFISVTLNPLKQKYKSLDHQPIANSSSNSSSSSSSSSSSPTGSDNTIDFVMDMDSQKYFSENYECIEMDCLLKLSIAENEEWTKDETTETDSSSGLFYMTAESRSLPNRTSSQVLENHDVRENTHSTQFSVQYYDAKSNMYVVGEVHNPVGNGEQEAIQKLVQTGKTLNFLKCKQQVSDVRDCVIGCIFFGSKVDKALATTLFRLLRHNYTSFPCLWSLLGYKYNPLEQKPATYALPCRFFGYQLKSENFIVMLHDVRKDVQELKELILFQGQRLVELQRLAEEQRTERLVKELRLAEEQRTERLVEEIRRERGPTWCVIM